MKCEVFEEFTPPPPLGLDWKKGVPDCMHPVLCRQITEKSGQDVRIAIETKAFLAEMQRCAEGKIREVAFFKKAKEL